MNICGVVAEYNPFHNGHAYQLEKAREGGATHIVSVMSGNFVQRGETAILDKFSRAEIAVKNGADLVIELPVAFSLSSAELFARGAISALSGLGIVNSLSFGCENDDISALRECSKLSDMLSCSEEMRDMMKDGISYPASLQKIADEKYPELSHIFRKPNNILAIEYLKQLDRQGLCIDIIPVKRTGAEHDDIHTSEEIASASYIREKICGNGCISEFVPKICEKALSGKTIEYDKVKELVLYRIRTMTKDEISDIPDVCAELAGRIFSASGVSSDYDTLMKKIHTKRYTDARVSRALCCALIGIKKNDIISAVPYIRVLALNSNGAQILKKAKSRATLPIDTSLARLSKKNAQCERFSELECVSSDIYAMCSGEKIGKDLTKKIEITE